MEHTSDSYLEDSTRASLGGMTTMDYTNNHTLMTNNRTSLNGTASYTNGHSRATNGTTYDYTNSYVNGGEDEELEEDDEEEITPAELIEKLQHVSSVANTRRILLFLGSNSLNSVIYVEVLAEREVRAEAPGAQDFDRRVYYRTD